MTTPQLRLPAFRGDVAPEVANAFRAIQRWADEIRRDNENEHTKLIHGVYAEYGELYFSSSSATALTVNVWTKAAGTTVLDEATGFTMPSNNRLLHTDTATEYYAVFFDFSITSASANQVIWVGISKNGATPTIQTQRQRKITVAGDAGMGATHGIIKLEKDAYVEGWIMNATGSNNATITHGALTAIKIV